MTLCSLIDQLGLHLACLLGNQDNPGPITHRIASQRREKWHLCTHACMVCTMASPPSSLPPITESHLRLLRIFRAVAEAGGLTAAEGRLAMERSTISRHLQTLETELGARLCHRGPAGFELTEFGQAALKVAVAASDALDMVRDELDKARNAVRGDLHFGVADICLTNPRCKVHQALAAFREQAPSATLHLSIQTANELRRGLRERRFHICITGVTPNDDSLRQQVLFPEEFQLYVSLPNGGDPPAVHTLQSRGYVLVTREGDFRTATLAKKLKLRHHAVALGLEAVATLLAGGGYVGFLPTHYVKAISHLHRFTEVQGGRRLGYALKFALTMSPEHRLPASGQLLARLLQQVHAP
jgi:DNA-binding transcriptional LysR family regulator